MKQITPANSLPIRFSDAVRFGVMISNAWPQTRRTEGATHAAIVEVLKHYPFFSCIQTVDIPFAAERRAVREIVLGSGRPHTYTLTRIMAENNLNPSSLDAQVRKRSCERIIACFEEALEAGATTLCFVSGSRPEDPLKRHDALRGLEESIATICEAARPTGLKIQVEPLDYEAHKRGTLGTTAEAVGICRRLAESGLALTLCIDSAHLLLNGEDIPTAVALARPHMVEFHICNAVLDRTHPLFGDRHLPLGAPGVVDCEKIASLFRGFIETGYIGSDNRPCISCEVMTPEGYDAMTLIGEYTQLVQQAWEQARGVQS